MKYLTRILLVIFIYLFVCLISRWYTTEYWYKQVIDIPGNLYQSPSYNQAMAEYNKADSSLFSIKTFYKP